MIAEANEYILSNQNKKDEDDDIPKPPTGGGASNAPLSDSEPANKRTLILDAICAPVNIRYSQDVSLLNEAREKLETIIYRFHKSYGLELPRRYAKRARKDYLAFAKCRKHTAGKIRKALRQQLSYVKRNIGYLEKFMSDGYARIERISFDAYNESACLKDTLERFKERTEHYPKRVLAD